jgi:DNA mismatch repair ATPase MutS
MVSAPWRPKAGGPPIKEAVMATLHVENTVRDFDEWKSVFDKFERFRADKRMRAYRLSRQVDDLNKVTIDMDFDSVEEATSFREALEQIWQTPQSKEQLVAHETPRLYDVVEHREL